MWNYLKAILLTAVVLGFLLIGPLLALIAGAVFVVMFVFFSIKVDLDEEDDDID